MFCSNCGNQIPDNARFCGACGKEQGAVHSPVSTPTAPAKQTKGKGKKIGGIVLTALGGLSVLGSFLNDYYYNILNNGLNSSDFVTLGMQISFIVAGILLIVKANKA